MSMSRLQLEGAARTAARAHGLEEALVCVICEHESDNWKQYAVRYEPAFYDRYVKDIKLSQTEKTMRATSFGLMQVMGQVAREFGFEGQFLTELLDPVFGLEYACRKLEQCMDRANSDVRTALLFYNGGGDPKYPDKVLRHLEKYKP